MESRFLKSGTSLSKQYPWVKKLPWPNEGREVVNKRRHRWSRNRKRGKEHKEHTKSSTEIAGTAVCCRRKKNIQSNQRGGRERIIKEVRNKEKEGISKR